MFNEKKEEYSKNDYFPTIIIKNEDEFFRLLEIYVNKTLIKPLEYKISIVSFIIGNNPAW